MSSSAPLVAVVTPVYNGGAYLDETMACVQAQTYSNLVHVVLDNASEDDTAAIIARGARGRVPLIAARNDTLLAQFANWNAAMAMIPPEAKYFRFLCADDLMTPDFVERTVAIAETDPKIGFVTCHQTNGQGLDHATPASGRTRFAGREIGRAWLLYQAVPVWIVHMLARTELLAKRPYIFDESTIFADIEFCLFHLKDVDYAYIHEELAFTRLHEATVTQTVVEPLMKGHAERYAFIERFGPDYLAPGEWEDVRRSYRRYYARQLLKWRLSPAQRQRFEWHRAYAARERLTPSLLDYADALGSKAVNAAFGRNDPGAAFQGLRTPDFV